MLKVNDLKAFLELIDKELNKKIRLVAVGGTAMTLLDLKPSTIDVDFTIPREDKKEFERALQTVPHGFKVDAWPDGMVFSQQLPADYLKDSIPIKTALRNIALSALHPVDIIVTKIGRLDKRDEQDIKACIERFGIKRQEVEKRARQVAYAGREENYKINLRHALENFWSSKKARKSWRG